MSCRQTALGNVGRRLDQGSGGSNGAAERVHRHPLVEYTLAAALIFHGVEDLIKGGRSICAVAGGRLLFLAVSPPQFRVVRDAEHDVPAIGGEQIALRLASSHGRRRCVVDVRCLRNTIFVCDLCLPVSRLGGAGAVILCSKWKFLGRNMQPAMAYGL